MVDMSVNTPIGNQPDEMKFFMVLLYLRKCMPEVGFIFKSVLFNCSVYSGQILISNPAGTQIHMTYFAVSHLSFWQAHIDSVGEKPGIRIFFKKRIHAGSFCLSNCRNSGILGNSPSVKNE